MSSKLEILEAMKLFFEAAQVGLLCNHKKFTLKEELTDAEKLAHHQASEVMERCSKIMGLYED